MVVGVGHQPMVGQCLPVRDIDRSYIIYIYIYIYICIYIYIYISLSLSLWDIRSMPTRSVFTFFQTFLNFWRNAPKCRHLGGGMCMLFEICGKTPFQKCMGWGGCPAPVEHRYSSPIRAEAVSLKPLPATYSGQTITVSTPRVVRCNTKRCAFNSEVYHFSPTGIFNKFKALL